jgi:uncharacterized membrane protein
VAQGFIQPQAFQHPEGGDSKMSEVRSEHRCLAASAYLVWPVGFLIVLTRLKSEPFLRFHGYQALFLGLSGLVAYLMLGLCLQVIPFFGTLLFHSLAVLWFFLEIFLAYRCLQGDYFHVPLIYELAKGVME